MPKMSGPDLARSVDLPVVYMTGYPDRASGKSTSFQGDKVLRKPFSEQDLVTILEACLVGGAAGGISNEASSATTASVAP